MDFTPKTEEEIQAECGLFPPANYPFEVTHGEDALSKAGNPMIHVRMRIFGDTREIVLDDYFVTATPYGARKFRHFCVSIGRMEQYNAGSVAGIDLVGCGGIAQVGIRKDKEGQFPDKNEIKDYLPVVASASARQMAKSVAPPAPTQPDDGIGEDVPF